MTVQLDTAGPGGSTWQSTKFTATVNATSVYVYGRSDTTSMTTAVWTAGDTVEQSWFTIGSDEDDMTVVISLVSGDITSATVYPGDNGVTQSIGGGNLTLTVPADAKNMRIEINGDRSECLHIFVKPLKDTLGASTAYPTLAIAVSSVDIGTDTITTSGAHGLNDGDRFLVKSTGDRPSVSGTELPEYEYVYALNTTSTTLQVSQVWPNSDGPDDIDDAGSGTITLAADTYTNSASTLYFAAGEHNIGRLFKPGDDVTVYLDAGAVVTGSFDLRGVQGVTITGPGTLSGTFTTYTSISGLSATSKREYSMFFGWNGATFNYTNQVKGITVAGQPYYLTFEGVWSWRNVSVMAPWKYEADGFKTSGYVSTNVSEVVDCFCFVGDDGIYYFHNFEVRTDSGNYVVAAQNSCYHGGYFADVALSASYSTTMSNCHATHIGLADSGLVGTYPSYGRSVILACWVDGWESDSAKGRTNYTINGLKVWGTFPGRLMTLGNLAYPYAAGPRDQAGQFYDWSISNVWTEHDMGQGSLIVGRDADNTPHDITFGAMTIGGVSITADNYTNYFTIDAEVYNLTWPTSGITGIVTPPTTDPPTEIDPATENSYATLSYANSYWSLRGNPATWTAATDATKQAALRQATYYLDDVYHGRWRGVVADSLQVLDWPRQGVIDEDGFLILDTVIPTKLMEATCELAYRVVAGTTLQPDIEAGSGSVSSSTITVGGISVAETFSGTQSTGPKFPVVDRKLRSLTIPGGRNLTRLTR